MRLEKSDRFLYELQEVVDFIAADNVYAALAFYDELIEKIEEISENPYRYRMNQTAYQEYSREMIFRGYTIPFFIDIQREAIVILGIFNQNIWE